MRISNPVEGAAQLTQICSGAGDAPDEQRDEGFPVGADSLRLCERLADDSAAPQRQPAGDLRLVDHRLTHALDRELGVAGVREHL
jgi:hypothetical protein